jgi:hypothetical protein
MPPRKSPDQKPDERQPELPRVRDGTIVDEHFAGVEPADEIEEVAQLDGILRKEPGTSSGLSSASSSSVGCSGRSTYGQNRSTGR